MLRCLTNFGKEKFSGYFESIHVIIAEYFQEALMTVLVNYAMFSIDPEKLVDITVVKYEFNDIVNACQNLIRYILVSKSISNMQMHSKDVVKIVTDNKQHLENLMMESLPSCGRMGLVCRY